MNEDPLARERRFRQSIEDRVLSRRQSHPARRLPRRVIGWIGGVALLLVNRWTILLAFFLCFGGFFFVLFGWAIKLTDAYACSVGQAGRNAAVIAELGEPIEPGFFAWSGAYRREASVTDTSFRTELYGPKGRGTLRVYWYTAPVGSSLRMDLEKDGRSQTVYSGPVNCP
jgi:hypothetical protein